MQFTGELSLKIRTAIKVKLAELGNDVYEELPDYIMVMVANKKSEQQMADDLALFLGDNTDLFTSWLHNLLSKLQSVVKQTHTQPEPETTPETNTESDRALSYESEPENCNEVASCATPGSDEASTSHQQICDDRTDGFESNNTPDVDSRTGALTVTYLDSPTCESRLSATVKMNSDTDGEHSDVNACDKAAPKRKTVYPETRVIKVKIRRVDRNGSTSKSKRMKSAVQSQSVQREKDKSNESSVQQLKSCVQEPEVEVKPSDDVVSSVQQKELDSTVVNKEQDSGEPESVHLDLEPEDQDDKTDTKGSAQTT